jgi:hypothetical protein
MTRLLALLSACAYLGAADPFRIELQTVSTGFDKVTCWVHARPGFVHGAEPAAVITLQKLTLKGSDVFGPLAEFRSDDGGRTWGTPVVHERTLGHRTEGDVRITPCDFWPKWHAKTGRLLGTGHDARYRNEKVILNRPRTTVYSVYDPASRTWAAWESLQMPDEPRFYSAGAGCTQRVDLPDGDVLLPIYFAAKDEKEYRVCVLRCAFDGRKLTVRKAGSEIRIPGARGAGEPSLAVVGGRYYLTVRHDLAAYVAVSDDGLEFSPPRRWTFDDGSDLGSYNTQAHWVTHRDRLFLVYTRRGANNDHIPRHRAPLFIGEVDVAGPRVIRASERVLVPERGARLGNFGVGQAGPSETWVGVTEWMQTTPPNPYDFTKCTARGSDNAVFVARLLWSEPDPHWLAR